MTGLDRRDCLTEITNKDFSDHTIAIGISLYLNVDSQSVRLFMSFWNIFDSFNKTSPPKNEEDGERYLQELRKRVQEQEEQKEQKEKQEEEDVYSRFLTHKKRYETEKKKYEIKIAEEIQTYNHRIKLLSLLPFLLLFIFFIPAPIIFHQWEIIGIVIYLLISLVLYWIVYQFSRFLSDKIQKKIKEIQKRVNEIPEFPVHQVFTATEMQILQRRKVKEKERRMRESETQTARRRKEQELQKHEEEAQLRRQERSQKIEYFLQFLNKLAQHIEESNRLSEQKLQEQRQYEEEERQKKENGQKEWSDLLKNIGVGLAVGLASKALNNDKVYVKGHYRKKPRKK